VVLLGTPGVNQTRKPVRLVGYKITGVKYMAIYCHEQFNEPVSIKRIRQLRNSIQNELRAGEKNVWSDNLIIKEQMLYAKT